MIGNIALHAALPVSDLQAGRDFYGNTLGMHEIDQNPNGVWFQSGNGKVVLYESQFAGTNQATCAVWEVGDPARTVRSLKARGVKFERYDGLPGVSRKGDIHTLGALQAAWFKDPFGNIICIATPL